MKTVELATVISKSGRRTGDADAMRVYSVTKHAGFVPSLDYFKKQVFSRDTSGYLRVTAGDFAYATIHLDEGSIGIAPEDALISPMYTVFRADPALVDSNYLIRFLKSPQALKAYEGLGQGAVHRRKSISLASLGTLPLPLPPLEEQRRIAAILDQADELRVKRNASLQMVNSLRTAAFQAGLSAVLTEPMQARRLMPFMRNGVSSSSTGTIQAEVLTLSAVTSGRYIEGHRKAGMFDAVPPEDKRVNSADLLISRGNGNIALVGVGVIPAVDQPEVVFPDTVIAGRIDSRLVHPRFLEAAWATTAVRDQISATARTTNGTFKVNQAGIGSVVVKVPSLEDQGVILQSLAQTEEQRLRGVTELQKLDALFASLQARAFRGEL